METIVQKIIRIECRIRMNEFLLTQIDKEFENLNKERRYLTDSEYEEVSSELFLERDEFLEQKRVDEESLINLKRDFNISELSRKLKKGGQLW